MPLIEALPRNETTQDELEENKCCYYQTIHLPGGELLNQVHNFTELQTKSLAKVLYSI